MNRRWMNCAFFFLTLGFILAIYLLILICVSPTNNEKHFTSGKDINSLIRHFQVPQINCSRLFEGDGNEIKKAFRFDKKKKKEGIHNEDFYINLAKNCKRFRKTRGYLTTHSVHEEERKFPIAFEILMYRDIAYTERLLRAIYRTHNYYCIHVDVNSNDLIKRAMMGIARCLDHVTVISVTHSARGSFAALQAEMTCLRVLHHIPDWKYVINLTGQEFPLKTNYEIVNILKIFNGANDIHGNYQE